ncbi:MAG: hypothetical protein ACYS22_01910 [Planctomycetota bacterium]|jgi:hypothetical protein
MERPAFKLVIHAVSPTGRDRARDELARLFAIDADIAEDILGAVPIILVGPVTLEAAKVVAERLKSLHDHGALLVLTNAPSDELPKVNWPDLPKVARVSAAEARGEAPAYQVLGQFACPSTGEMLHIVRMGSAPVRGAATPVPLSAGRAPATVPLASVSPPPLAVPAEFSAPAPRPQPRPAAEPSPARSVPAADLDQGPLVRALHQKREQRESQRLQAERPQAPPPGRAAGSRKQAPTETVPASVPEPDFFEESDAFDRLLLDEQRNQHAPGRPAAARPERSAPTRSEPRSPAARTFEQAPAPAFEKASSSSGLETFDIDEALRLLDNAPLANAVAGAESAPAPDGAIESDPISVHVPGPELPDLVEPIDFGSDFAADSGLIDFSLADGEDLSDIDSDIAELEKALTTLPADAGSLGRGSERKLEPLDAEEALKIFNSSSSEDLFEVPGSEDLVPLDPNEALAFLSSEPAPASKKGRGKPRSRTKARPSNPKPKLEPEQPKKRRLPKRGKPDGGTKAGGTKGGRKRKAAAKSERARAVDPGDNEPVHGLVLSRINGDSKRQKAAEIIAELTQMPKTEALKLTDRTIIPVLKGVTRRAAESALDQFQRSKISGRVTTRRLGR